MSARTGPKYKLAEWLDQVWDSRVPLTNVEAAKLFGVQHNMVSQWRKGASRVHIGHLVTMSRLLEADLAFLLRLWLDQDFGGDPDHMREIALTFDRLATKGELGLLKAVRDLRPDGELTAMEVTSIAEMLRPGVSA